METLTTRVFNNGNSQAVRIPAEFRLSTDRVAITRTGQGELILRPLPAQGARRGAALLEALQALAAVDAGFVAALEAARDREALLPAQERESF